MGIIQEFKEFALKGNVIDLAVGVVIGAAFNKITDSLVKDVITPPIGYLVNGIKFDELKVSLGKGLGTDEIVTINYGLFIQASISFLITAFVIFMIVKQINRLRRKPEAQPDTTKKCTFCKEVIDIEASRCPRCTSELAQ